MSNLLKEAWARQLEENAFLSDEGVLKSIENNGYMVFRVIGDGSLGYAVYNTKLDTIQATLSKNAYTSKVRNISKIKLKTDDITLLLNNIPEIQYVKSNPFEKEIAYYEDDYTREISINNIRYSKYMKNIKKELGDYEVDIFFKMLRTADKNHFLGVSFAEIALSHYFFEKKK